MKDSLIGVFSAVGTIAAIITTTLVVDKVSYGKDGYNKNGFDREGYDRNGFNKYGFNKNGFNKDGYDKYGFNISGFNKEGYDKSGYNSNGYDKFGFSRSGYDKEGYDKKGYDRSGYNRAGYDEDGYDKKGYDESGLDISDYGKSYYKSEYTEILNYLEKAKEQMKKNEFSYALHDIRIAIEKGVKCIICHKDGDFDPDRTLDSHITYCKYNYLIDEDFIELLYNAKNHCNSLQHDNNCKKNYDQIHFAYKVAEQLANLVKESTM